MHLLGLDETLNGAASASWALWHRYVLRIESKDVFKKALNVEVVGRRGSG